MTNFQLTPAHLTAMHGVRTGANVFSRGIAQLLRDIERHDPELIDIFTPQELREDVGCTDQDLHDAEGRMCYFGAILTAKGRAFLQRNTATMVKQSLKGTHEDSVVIIEEPEIIQGAMQDDLPGEPSLQVPKNI